MNTARHPRLLCVLDGFGFNPNPVANAIAMANTPHFSELWSSCPHTTLITYGERVGLPAGQMGNSEVGHLNIGAGRVVEQWLLRISRTLGGGRLHEIEAYQRFLRSLQPHTRIHIAGLFSDGGVHSHSEHMLLLLKRLQEDCQNPIALHLITDGRDTAPNRAVDLISDLMQQLKSYPRVQIATISGRFYAMDRDKRWERTHQAYQAIALAEAPRVSDPIQAIRQSYAKNVSDEFIEPLVVNPLPIQPDDAFIFFNFREDRARQIVRALCLKEFSEFPRTAPLFATERVLCFTDYDANFHLPYLFHQLDISNHLGETLSKAGLTQLRVAETEKYPHVTYFLNGGIEKEYPGETRIMLPSPRDVKTYDLKPEMSAIAVTDQVVKSLDAKQYDLIVVNLANCDMVGHTGILSAAIKAVETVDTCLGRMIEALRRNNGQAIILADHGNAEQMLDYKTNTPHTAHTLFPVPCIVVGSESPITLRDDGALCDVAPTMLNLMSLPQPKEMTGQSLIQTA